MHVCIYAYDCVYMRVCVWVSRHYTVADVSSATLFALLRGPSIHVGLEAKEITFARLLPETGGQS